MTYRELLQFLQNLSEEELDYPVELEFEGEEQPIKIDEIKKVE